jgi:hypothetical protein
MTDLLDETRQLERFNYIYSREKAHTTHKTQSFCVFCALLRLRELWECSDRQSGHGDLTDT